MLPPTPQRWTPLNYFLLDHMKSLVYETSVDSVEYLLARVMAAADVGLCGIGDRVDENMIHRYVYALKSLVVTSSPSCKWTQKNKNVQ